MGELEALEVVRHVVVLLLPRLPLLVELVIARVDLLVSIAHIGHLLLVGFQLFLQVADLCSHKGVFG